MHNPRTHWLIFFTNSKHVSSTTWTLSSFCHLFLLYINFMFTSNKHIKIYPASRIKGAYVIKVMEHIKSVPGLLGTIKVNNEPKFISKDLDNRSYKIVLNLTFLDLKKSTDNAILELFNRFFRDKY